MASTEYNSVVLDIEGTITPITFVKEVLFPYVTRGLDAFLDRTWGSDDLKEYIQLLREQAHQDVQNKVSPAAVEIPTEEKSSAAEVKDAVKKNIQWQMAMDRKIGALKAFQGFMWREGYKSGELRGEIYDDVVPALDRWLTSKKIYIYSSGSVPAQKLLVGHSTKGDLSKYFSGYFDTTVGLKTEVQSYKAIAQEIGETDPQRILFVSDNIKEIQAAKEAGYQVVISDRPGNAPLGPESAAFQIVTTFAKIH
ncbi:2,3-diketo-5-methylthio-1-phosphopentane phosphatase [Radiomyces spectabilis]|uniref:2,3-diketo-5-methylthio-1-phosphopentane phosphatase n=1 Tax=Radiomyces spectabilis TaxID=64574 RepID=UPI0022201DA6|nr:2,3-diketo-5-methylthio-1-phosphopentane phosphatase [Radiomyces spectabilis]KAI8370432.1 2,3-diketo-5-methylthio-1-phosphopentane phosphatase [Radiomyces spectabilis]